MNGSSEFLNALRFMTIVPVPLSDAAIEPDWLSRCAKYFPVVGIGIGLASAVVLLLARIPLWTVLPLVAAEFVVHFALDFAKAGYGRGVDPDEDAQRFWALHGLDQLFHQLTYIGMVYFAIRAMGAV